jgi:hypothetical protein
LGGNPLSYEHALDLLEQDEVFREYLTSLLAGSDYSAFRWETPPISQSKVGRAFEFVLVSDPYLGTKPEPDVFSPYFAATEEDVTVLPVPNLGRTATMIVPKQLAALDAYGHMAAFVRKAPRPQVHALWQCVAHTAKANLSSQPTWISTAGGGVSWLHVRIEHSPKYYAYRRYANEA